MRDEQCRLPPLALLGLQNWLSPAFPIGSYSYSHRVEWAVETVDQLNFCRSQQAHCSYVLEGSILTQLKGAKTHTVHAGEVFYESPTDIHIASRNASNTQPAKLLVFFVKKIGAPPTVAVEKATLLAKRVKWNRT